MTLTPNLDSLKGLFRKLERESYRAYHATSTIHKADHFFNFCVTGHSLRDYLLEDLGKHKQLEKAPFHDVWDNDAFLVAVAEIANSSKHFRLRRANGALKTVRTREVAQTMNDFVDIYRDGEGRLSAVQVKKADIEVVLSDGRRFALYEFTASVLAYWSNRLEQHGLRITKQSLARLSGA
jgi:hypothetical protein